MRRAKGLRRQNHPNALKTISAPEFRGFGLTPMIRPDTYQITVLARRAAVAFLATGLTNRSTFSQSAADRILVDLRKKGVTRSGDRQVYPVVHRGDHEPVPRSRIGGTPAGCRKT